MYTSKNFVPIDDPGNQSPSNVYVSKNFVPLEGDTTKSQGILGKLANSDIVSGINQLGGTIARGLEYAGAGVANAPVAAANYLNQKLAGAFGVHPQNVPTPDLPIPNPQNLPMPGVSQQNQSELDPYSQALGSAILLAQPAGDIAKLGVMGGKAVLNKLSGVAGFNADDKANNFINSLLGDNSFSKSHLPVLNELRQNYGAVQEASTDQYNNVLNQGAERGYTGAKQFPGISVATGEKSIIPNNFQDNLSSIDLSLYSKKIQNLLNPFSGKVNNNLSFSDAHELQSQLGNEGAKLRTSADGTQRYLGGELLGLRDTLKNDITGSLLANNDTDLAQQYDSASDFYKNNVAPYRENSVIRSVVTKKGNQEVNPATIGNVLKKEDGSILPIANQLSPESKNLLLANQLKNSTQELPDAVGNLQRNTSAENLVSAYGALDNKGLGYLRSPETNQEIASIMQDLSRKQMTQSILNKLKIPAAIAGTAAVGVPAYKTAREFL